MVAGPEQSRILKEFESKYLGKSEENIYHHEEGQSTQSNFNNQVVSLVEIMTEMGNPFLDDTGELIILDTHIILDDSVVKTIRNIESLGRQQYDEYTKPVIVDRTRSISETIKKNNLPLLRSSGKKVNTKTEQNQILKDNLSLFSRLFIVTQQRGADMDTFFKHENHPTPPSISEQGKLRSGTKSDLLNCLLADSLPEPPTAFDVKILDGAAVVHMLPVNAVATFSEYTKRVFLPHVSRQLETCQRIGVVLDTYIHPK